MNDDAVSASRLPIPPFEAGLQFPQPGFDDGGGLQASTGHKAAHELAEKSVVSKCW